MLTFNNAGLGKLLFLMLLKTILKNELHVPLLNSKLSWYDVYELDLTLLKVSHMHIIFHPIKLSWPTT